MTSRRKQSSLPTVSDCGGCGVCCMHMGYPVFLRGMDTQPDEEHWTALPAELKEELLRYIAEYPSPPHGELDGACFWFDVESRRCRYHEHRPRVCRDFAVGSKQCLDWRSHYNSHQITVDS